LLNLPGQRPGKPLALLQPGRQPEPHRPSTPQGPFGREKLAPILSLFTADGQDDGIGLCRQILGNEGRGHTAVIHTRSERLQLSFAQQMPVSRVLVNTSAAQGCIGVGDGLTPSFTLGCGTYGRTSTTDNVTYTHLINVKRMARPLADVAV